MANLFLTGSGAPTSGIGEATDYYRDTVTNLIYYKDSPTNWVGVPSLIPTPDGVGTTWLYGSGEPSNSIGEPNDYYRNETNGVVYRKDGSNEWQPKGTLDFIGVYGVQWGNGLGAPANITPLNNLPAGSFYLDVITSDIYYKDPSLAWVLKGKLGGGDGVATTAYADAAANSAKTYADGLVIGLLDDRGNYDPTDTSLYPTTGGSGEESAILKGDLWTISDNGNVNGIAVTVGDTIRALVDAPAQNNANWAITQNNLTYVPENSTNKATSLDSPDNTKYPTTLAVSNAIAASLDPTINTQTGTSYTVGTVAADNDGKTYLRMDVASANTVTIPTTQTKPISIRQAGTGTTTLVAGSGVTLNGTLAFTAQHQTKTVIPLGQVGGTGNYRFDIVG